MEKDRIIEKSKDLRTAYLREFDDLKKFLGDKFE